MSDGRKTEKWEGMKNVLKGSGLRLIEVLFWYVTERAEENHENFQSGCLNLGRDSNRTILE
jgi:hypothetical protein